MGRVRARWAVPVTVVAGVAAVALTVTVTPTLVPGTPVPRVPVAAGTAPAAPAVVAAAPAVATEAGVKAAPATTAARRGRPNIVFVLMDDFSMDLLQTMRSAQRMRRRGAEYQHAYVVDSLCCVSRTSTLTGQYPHQTGVRLNTANTPNRRGPLGGWAAFRAYGNGGRSVNAHLRNRGYTTGFVGKFLNQYNPPRPGTRAARPPGWSEWRPVFASAYDGWGYAAVRRDGRVQQVGRPRAGASKRAKDAKYAGSFISRTALDFIRRHENDRRPYFLHVSPYATHARTGDRGAYRGDPFFPPMFRDRPSRQRPQGNCGAVRCGSLDARDLVGFANPRADNRPRWADGRVAPAWRTRPGNTTRGAAVHHLRNRARMAQSVDRMVTRILSAVGRNTYVVLTSDNGFHLGQHQLRMGKGTPYDSDVRVPLLVTGPGVVPGVRDQVVTNVDLAPTFEAMAGLGAPSYRFGRSFAGTLRAPGRAQRRYAFFEHTWAPSLGGNDPDRQFAGGTMDLIPSYVAVRDRRGLLVRFDLDNRWDRSRFAWEYYDYRDARFERTNTFGRPGKAADVRRLRARLRAFVACSGPKRSRAVPSRCRALTQ